MDFKKLFEGKDLPTVKQDVGMVSIDTLERQWQLIAELPENRIVVISDSGATAVIGKLAIRDDGKFCFVFELVGKVGKFLEEIKMWHMEEDDYGWRYDEIVHALIEAGKLS